MTKLNWAPFIFAIPGHEVEGLYMDLISEENLPNLPVIIPPEQIRALTPKKAQNVEEEEEERKPNSGKKSEIRVFFYCFS